jgi:hypothetical protein
MRLSSGVEYFDSRTVTYLVGTRSVYRSCQSATFHYLASNLSQLAHYARCLVKAGWGRNEY